MTRSVLLILLGIDATGCGRLRFDGVPSDATSILASFEAESGAIESPFAIVADASASNGAFVIDGNQGGITGAGDAVYGFTLDHMATIYLWGRTRATDTSTDSMFVSFDGGVDHPFETADCSYDNQWHWVFLTQPYMCPDARQPYAPSLDVGMHTLALHSREGQSVIDKIILSDDPTFVATD